MNAKHVRLVWLISVVLATSAGALAETPAGTGFTYQGRLSDEFGPYSGPVDLVFGLFDDASGGSLVGTDSHAAVPVVDGLFVVDVDFGGAAFNGSARWLEITVDGTPLTPRQLLTAAPYALQTRGLYVDPAGNVGVGTASPASRLDVAGAVTATSFIGDGSALSGIEPCPWLHASTGIAYVADGPLAGWGSNQYGQINVPAGSFSAIAAGHYHSLAIRTDGTIAGWGSNDYGEANSPEGTFSAIAAGAYHSVAIRDDGTLIGWGRNDHGQINVPGGTFTAVASGFYHSLAIRSDGTLAEWGHQNGDPPPAGTFTAIACGMWHSLGIRSDGTLAAWGSNSSGQLNVPAGTFIAIAGGDSHSLAVRSDGTLAAWGYNDQGQCNVPTGTYAAVAGGARHSLALRTNGTLAGWGSNEYGVISVPTGAYTRIAAARISCLACSVGRVGVGTDAPTEALTVAGTIQSTTGGFKFPDGSVQATANNWVPAAYTYALSASDGNPANVVYVDANGYVGIGTTTPTYGKVHIAGSRSMNLSYAWLATTWPYTGWGSGTYNYSLYTTDRIAAPEFNAFSDARTKRILGRSDGAADLASLMAIEVTDYTPIDAVSLGNETRKKVIGQQVRTIYPQAVALATEVVPDIYRPADVKDGWIMLATDLRSGERVQLITEHDVAVRTVLEACDDRFRVDVALPEVHVFVYGREVSDFHNVDYDAISMLNVSATQELYRQVREVQADNAALAEQVRRLQSIVDRLAALEARVREEVPEQSR